MKKALLVGLDNYQKENKLSCCANDACAINELLEVNGDGTRNFDTKLIAGECTKNELYYNIYELFKGNEDISLLYFSGHGAENDGGYLVTTDFTSDNLGVRMDDILNLANNSPCKNKVIILDCCFSGAMGQSLLLKNKALLGDGVTILSASRANEASIEEKTMGHGLFTGLLIQGLSGGAADISGSITPASLYSFVDQSLGAWQQRPVFKTNISQFLPLRNVVPRVSKEILRKIKDYFKNPEDFLPLDPSYEFTNVNNIPHSVVKPYANPEHVAIFKDLQALESIGLVEPVGEDHMYFAAMHNKSCRLTLLGIHYWHLAEDKRF